MKDEIMSDKNSILNEELIQKYENELTHIIRQRLGIVIHRHQMKELYKTIVNACKEFKCMPREYIDSLQICNDDSPLLNYLVVHITVGETYFYRDISQMQLLMNEVLPKMIKKKRDENDLTLRIWSAGCSTGDEIYTIAMMLTELLNDSNQWTIDLLGTDINTLSLRKAVNAHYSEWSMRSIPANLKQKYFIKEGNVYKLLDHIRNMVKFTYVNLNNDVYPSMFNRTNSQDLILCRNVLIYFDNTIIQKIMNKFSQSLNPGGYLLLGASDPVLNYNANADFQYHPGMLFSRALMNNQQKQLRQAEQAKQAEQVRQVKREKQTEAKVAQKNIQPASPSISKREVETNLNNIPKERFNQNKIMQLLEHGDWQSILDVLQDNTLDISKSETYMYAKATALANLGKLVEAVRLFQTLLLAHPTNKYSHFTYALALLELNKMEDAELELRKSIFLDRNFVIGYYQLGLLLMRNRKHEAGLKCLKNALAIAVTKNSTEPVLGSQGLCYGRLSEILKHEIKLYSSTTRTHYHAH